MHGMCHVTGGGLLNFRRLCPFGFTFDTPISPPRIFTWMQETGKISPVEMYRTFNMGMGYAYVVPPASVDQVLQEVTGAQVVGSVVRKPGVWLRDTEIT
jgi:phosphoribosylformylglycinamidine cyclo-ligase